MSEIFFLRIASTVRRHGIAFLILLAGAAGIAACGNKEAKTDLVLAVVDGFEITISQFNAELSRMTDSQDIEPSHGPMREPNRLNAAGKQILDAMIDRYILTHEAIREKFDRDPAVIGAVENEKEKILVQAYLRAAKFQVQKPAKEEIDDYYRSHPDLFAKRKLFDVTQVIISAKNADMSFDEMGNSSKSLRKITDWLDRHQVSYSKVHLTLAATELPEKMSNQVGRLSHDRVFIINEDGHNRFCTMRYLGDNPIGENEASAQIENILLRKKEQEAITAEIVRLRALARIEYRNFPSGTDKSDRAISVQHSVTPSPPIARALRAANIAH